MESVKKYREEKSTVNVNDELVTFLSSPLFQVPVLTFTESNCIIFESGTDDCSSYQEMYADYQKLIGILLDDFLKESDMSRYDVIKCLETMKKTSEYIDILSVIQEEIVAAENYGVFVRLMVQKNLELQQQALVLVMNRTGRRDILQPQSHMGEEDKILRLVLEQSRLEYEEDEKRNTAELDQLRAIMASSAVEASLLEERRSQEKVLMTQALQHLDLNSEDDCLMNKPIPTNRATPVSQQADIRRHYDHESSPPTHISPTVKSPPTSDVATRSSKDSVSKTSTLTPHITADKISKRATSESKKDTQKARSPSASKCASSISPSELSGSVVTSATAISSSEAAANWLKSAHTEATARTSNVQPKMTAEMSGLTQSEISQRQAYLRKQRDILLAMKKREREKQLERAQAGQPPSARLSDVTSGMEGAGDTIDGEYERKLAMRKAIAEKVRSELMKGEK